MWVDVSVLLVMLVTVALGWWRGFLEQFLGIAGLVVAWLATPTLSPWIAKALAGRGYTAGSVAVASALISFSVVVLLFRIAQGYLPEALEKWSHGAKRMDSGLGAVLGGVRGLLLCWLILSAGALVQGTLLERYPQLATDWKTSEAVRATHQYNPIAEVSLAKLARLRKALVNARTAGQALGQKDDAQPSSPAQGVSNTKRVDEDAVEPAVGSGRVPRPNGKVLADPALRAAAKRKDWGALLADRRVDALLRDEEALKRALAGVE